MDTARYIVALLVWITIPPALAYWFLVHPFVAFWRQVGTTPTLWAVGIAFVAMMVGLLLIRDRVLTAEFGTHWILWVTAASSYVVAAVITIHCRKHLTFRTLAGVPEVEPDQTQRKLLDKGIYGRVRHPRYVSVMFGVLAMALFSNYAAVWILLPVTGVTLYVIAVLEERELVASMGRTYEDYRERVPMFIPRKW